MRVSNSLALAYALRKRLKKMRYTAMQWPQKMEHMLERSARRISYENMIRNELFF
jgi:hypothetical protein